MKYFIALIFSLYLANGVSQVWTDSAAKWTFDYWNIGEEGTWRWEYTNDTIVQGKTCQVIESTKHRFWNDQFGNLFGASSSGDNIYTYSSNDSVFYWKNNQFFLLYDFGASIGDTWIVSIDTIEAACEDTALVEVVDTGSVVINGFNLRTITLQTNSNSLLAMNGVAIERFGIDNFGFLPNLQYCPGGPVFESDILTFRCYEDINFPVYNPNNLNCDTLIVSINNEFEFESFSLYPNPAKDLLLINIKQQLVGSIEILDMNGRVIFNAKSINRIDVSNLDSGIYLIRVKTKKGLVTKSFVKE